MEASSAANSNSPIHKLKDGKEFGLGLAADKCEEDKENSVSEFGSILNGVPTILERVLTHLPMRDLNRCSQVCRAWNQLGRTVKRKRQTLFWMFWAARRRKLPPSVCSSCSITEHVRHVLDFASSQPKLGILFVTNSFFEVQGRYAEESSTSDTPVIDYLASALPRDCFLMGTCSSGMVGTTLGGNRQCCVEVESTEGFSCLLLPLIPGMEVYPFIIKHNDDLMGHETQNFLSDAELSKLTNVPVGKNVKCLFLFCIQGDGGEIGARLVANTLLKKQNYQMALGGGFVDTFVAPQTMLSSNMYLPHTMGLCICGDRVRAASVILHTSIRKRKSVEKVLEQLKACNLATKNSFALMFACIGRGIEHYGEPNVEADVFQKMFPNTPLFGLFGNGEIGVTHLPKDDRGGVSASGEDPNVKKFSFSSPQTKKRRLADSGNTKKIFHGYTTIIVMVSVDK